MSNEIQNILLEASRAFSEAGMNYSRALDSVCTLLAEKIGDGCAIRTATTGPGGRTELRCAAVRHRDPSRFPTLEKITNAPEHTLIRQAFETAQEFHVTLESDVPGIREGLLKLDAGAALILPLRAHHRMIGTLVLFRNHPCLAFTDEQIVVAREVSERAALALENARLYEQAHETLALLDLALTHAPVGFCLLDADLHYIHINPALAKINGIPIEEHLGRSMSEIIPLAAPSLEPLIRQVLESQTAMTNIEVSHPHPQTGDEMHSRVSYFPISHPAGGRPGVAVISLDITDLKIAERRNQAAVKLRDDFLSIASHELKTPLTPLKIQLQNLLRQAARGTLATLPTAKSQKLIESCERQISRLARLVDDLLDTSRISEGKLTLHREMIDLGELVQNVLDRFEHQLKEAESNVQVNIVPKIRGVWDPLRLEQIVANLISNAIKYAPGAPIEISVGTREGKAEVSVKDRGPGIPVSDQSRIFERFERGDSAGQPKASGLGLGLFIANQIADAHGGSLMLKSDPSDPVMPGASFTLQLPLLGIQGLARDH